MIWLWVSLAIAFFAAELVILKKYAACFSLSSLVTAITLLVARKSGSNIEVAWQFVIFLACLAVFVSLVIVYNKFFKK